MGLKNRLVARLVAIALAVTLVLAVLAHPKASRADTEEAFILAGAALGAYLTFLVVATSIAYGGPAAEFAQTDVGHGGMHRHMPRRGQDDRTLHLGMGCAQTGGAITLACW